jgi:hypothetical protein
MIEALSACATDPSFRESVLPRAPEACPHRVNGRRLEYCKHLGTEFGIAVQNGIFVRAIVWEGIAQLLTNPFGGWMSGDIEVQNYAPAMS